MADERPAARLKHRARGRQPLRGRALRALDCHSRGAGLAGRSERVAAMPSRFPSCASIAAPCTASHKYADGHAGANSQRREFSPQWEQRRSVLNDACRHSLGACHHTDERALSADAGYPKGQGSNLAAQELRHRTTLNPSPVRGIPLTLGRLTLRSPAQLGGAFTLRE